ncbi:MAG TPA: RT0821/Lpp0805 family surface protein [Myxococcota bacterium]|nr:RT0821/Lpp0805 family surface protein [Myxococcota bacterium]
MRLPTVRAGRLARPALALLLASSVGLSACVGPAMPGPKTQIGAATGAAAGGLIGAAAGGKTKGIIAGVLLGGLAGGAIGNYLDANDREYATNNSYYALERTPAGTTSSWQNPDSGNSGSVTPLQTYQTDSGYCREFEQTIRVGGRNESAHGTACRQPDGSWRIVQ